MAVTDEYLREVVGKGDEGSALLAKICSPTLRNSSLVHVVRKGMNGIAVLRIPADHLIVVHSVGGDPRRDDLSSYSESLVERLVEGSRKIGATPVAFADVIDASNVDLGVIETIGKSLALNADRYGLAIINGELAGLGDRVTVPANISGTMVSFIPRTAKFIEKVPGNFSLGGINYAVFDAEGKPIYVNSDGVGTKLEFAERSGRFDLSLSDSLAMKADDAEKLAAQVRVVSDVVETNGFNPMLSLSFEAAHLAKKFGFEYILQHENVGKRIRTYKEGLALPAINVSGSAVSTIDENLLLNLPIPSAGEYLIAIRGKPNPRSNGITDKRKVMIELLGQDWHETEAGKIFMEFLGEPSTVFYGLFGGLRRMGFTTSSYHMSGGAFEGKLAKPLAKHDLFVKIENLFPADWREYTIAGRRFTQAEVAYAKWPMGNEGFVTTSNPGQTMNIINSSNLESRIVGQLETAKCGRTGVELVGIRASNGENVYYSGRK